MLKKMKFADKFMKFCPYSKIIGKNRWGVEEKAYICKQ